MSAFERESFSNWAVSRKSLWRHFFCLVSSRDSGCGISLSAIVDSSAAAASTVLFDSVCKQCTTGAWCRCCLGYFQVSVCLSGPVSVSKFSLCHSHCQIFGALSLISADRIQDPRCDSTGFFPRICQIFSSKKIQ